MVVDLSFLNPQALSRRSWLLRVPFLRALGSRAAPWNSLWVETFELTTPQRPEVCEKLIDDALPRWVMPNQRWIAGYVWHGGFTIYRVPPWHSSYQAMGTGELSSDRGMTHIRFRVGSNRIGIYTLALLSVVFVLAGLGMLASAFRGVAPLPFALIGAVVMSLPAAMFIAGGRSVGPDGRRSEEADKLLAIVADLVGAEELASS